jgi:hypothetical protein
LNNYCLLQVKMLLQGNIITLAIIRESYFPTFSDYPLTCKQTTCIEL